MAQARDERRPVLEGPIFGRAEAQSDGQVDEEVEDTIGPQPVGRHREEPDAEAESAPVGRRDAPLDVGHRKVDDPGGVQQLRFEGAVAHEATGAQCHRARHVLVLRRHRTLRKISHLDVVFSVFTAKTGSTKCMAIFFRLSSVSMSYIAI